MRFLLFIAAALIIWWLMRGMLRPRPAMSREEAAKLLGVSTDAGPDEVIEAHRRLIAKVHPDTGGTADLAARVNQARDLLISGPRG